MAITLTYITTLESTGNLTTYDLGDVTFAGSGTAVIIAAARSSGSSRTLASGTIGGNAIAVHASFSSPRTLGVATCDVTSGDRNVTVVFSDIQQRCRVAVYLMTGHASNTPYDTDVPNDAGGTSLAYSMDYPTDGVGVYGIVQTGTEAVGWSAASEDSDATVETNTQMAFAHKTASGAGNTETASWTSSFAVTGVSAVWEPSGGGGATTAAKTNYYRSQQA